MKKLVKSFLVVATLLAMTMGMATLVSAVEPTVTAPEVLTDADKPVVRAYEYNQNSTLSSSEEGVIIPVRVNKPGVALLVISGLFEEDGYISASTDQEGKNWSTTGLFDSFDKNEDTIVEYFKAPKAGTYYVRISTISNETYTNRFGMTFCYISNTQKTVTPNKKYLILNQDYNKSQVFKYKAPANGTVQVEALTDVGSSVTVLNSKKKEIASKSYFSKYSGYVKTFAVKKGQTYYFNISGVGYNKFEKIKFKFNKVKEKSGKKKAKAAKLKAKKKAKGIVNIGDKGDWYKFVNKKTKKVQINIKVAECNNLVLTVYDGKGKKIDSTNLSSGKYNFYLTHSRTYGIAQKGTYYIKISGKEKKKSSGYYELSWK